MPFHVIALLACAIAIYLACELFVNAVEWLGVRLKMGTIAIGTVLAAIGTACARSAFCYSVVRSSFMKQAPGHRFDRGMRAYGGTRHG